MKWLIKFWSWREKTKPPVDGATFVDGDGRPYHYRKVMASNDFLKWLTAKERTIIITADKAGTIVVEKRY